MAAPSRHGCVACRTVSGLSRFRSNVPMVRSSCTKCSTTRIRPTGRPHWFESLADRADHRHQHRLSVSQARSAQSRRALLRHQRRRGALKVSHKKGMNVLYNTGAPEVGRYQASASISAPSTGHAQELMDLESGMARRTISSKSRFGWCSIACRRLQGFLRLAGCVPECLMACKSENSPALPAY